MKSRFLAVLLIAMAQTSFAQYFNHRIPDFDFNADNRQTITRSLDDQIAFLSVNTNSPNFPKDFQLMKMDQAGNYLYSARLLDTLGSVKAVSIIPTYDNGFLVVGIYTGYPPSLYPPYDNIIHTTFYAKFTSTFALSWFYLHYSYPQNQPTMINKQVEPYGVVAVPSSSSPEDYVILNFGSGYDTITHKLVQTILLDKIDASGHLLREVRPLIPSTYYINGLSAISYLPTNNMLAVNGIYINFGMSSAPTTPFLFTCDPGLTSVSNYTKYTSAYNGYLSSNVIEDQTNPDNLLFCYSTANPSPYPLTCDLYPKASSLVYLRVQAGHTSNILFNQDYTSPCMQQPRNPFTIKSINGEPDNILIGFTEIRPLGTAGISSLPSILKLHSDDGGAISYHHYNPSEHLNRLQYFEQDDADSFILHINSIDSSFASRIIKTDGLGQAFCTELPEIIPFNDSIVGIDTDLVFIVDSSMLIKDFPVMNHDEYHTFACDSIFHKPTTQTTGISTKIDIYPNPSFDNINIVIAQELAPRHIEIVNMVGQVVKSTEVTTQGETITVNTSALSPGIYILRFIDQQNKTHRYKFLKE